MNAIELGVGVVRTALFLLAMTLGSCVFAQVDARTRTKESSALPVRDMSAVTASERRFALVIGNNDYRSISKLKKAVGDAESVGRELAKADFDTTTITNATKATMDGAISSLIAKVSGGGVAVIFFSGHGFQIDNRNFLAPVDTRAVLKRDELQGQSVNLQEVQEKLEKAKAKFALLIIDACRDNPLPQDVSRGNPPRTPSGQIVVYSAGTNQQALDALSDRDTDPNGLFTREFLPMILKPGISVTDALKMVKNQVIQKAKSVNHDQTPAIYEQTDGDFYFRPIQTALMQNPVAPVAVNREGMVDRSLLELEYWKSAQQTNTAEAFQAYLSKFPDGQFVDLANTNIARLLKASGENRGTGRRGDDLAIELAMWEGASRSGDFLDYREYLRQYPNGTFATLARNRIQSLQTKEAEAVAELSNKALAGDAGALAQVRRLAEKNNVWAQTAMGAMYRKGLDLGSAANGLPKNDREAVKWFQLAAAQNHGDGQAQLGAMYEGGLGGLPKSDVEAVKWYQRAADQESKVGQERLALMHAGGRGGLPMDEIRARELLGKAGLSPSAIDIALSKSVDEIYEKTEGGECKGKGIRYFCQVSLKAKLCKEHNAYGRADATICPSVAPQ